MMKILPVVIYLIFGGYFMGMVAGDMKKECGKSTTISEFALSSIAWPAFISGAIAMKINGNLTGEVCSNKPSK